MKKIIALMMLCLLLCACCATAFAATVTFKPNIDGYIGSMDTVDTVNNEFTLPDCGFLPPTGTDDEFVGWSVDNMLYHPGEKAKVYGDKNVFAIWKSQNRITIEYKPGRGTADETMKGRVLEYPDEPCDVFGIDSFGYTAPANESFVGWRVLEGKYDEVKEEPDYGGSLGWLFTRAIAEDGLLKKDQEIIPKGNLILEAQWSNNPAGGGQGGGGQGGGDNGGGGNGGAGNGGAGNGSNAAANNMPSTGDNSMRIDFLFVVMLASFIGLRLMAKKRIN